MRNVQDTRSVMESAGFKLRNVDEPGIYVRRGEQEDSIDWQSEPTELLLEVQKRIESYRTQSGGAG